MIEQTPMSSFEVRWFFEGPVASHPQLASWFESTRFTDAPLLPVEWRGRLGDQPDRYLVLPGAVDMGIKWREGDFQLKGRIFDLGLQRFVGGHTGRVERWMKWSYGNVPPAYLALFSGEIPGLLSVPVGKVRALRKFRLNTFNGEMEEVPSDSFIDRGLGAELTEIDLLGSRWCSLGFEAFPDDSAMPAHFLAGVSTILESLNAITLQLHDSLSYPAWLHRLTRPGAE